MAAGFDHARGDVIVTMDADLQNDPADIPALLAKLDEGYDVVSGWREDRKDKYWTRRIPSRIANWLISRISGVHAARLRLHAQGVPPRGRRRARLYGEMHRFMPALAASWGTAWPRSRSRTIRASTAARSTGSRGC